ncbi:MAG: glutamine-synthetase adenylyltransferase [Marinibacterium sp.]|nr:glutamine-synthetase adenylyltransferase [Marinibacterium sp.]
MNFASRMTRSPRPFDSALGAEVIDLVGALPDGLSDLLVGTAGSSPYLGGLIRREAAWLPQAFDDPDAAVAAIEDDMRALAPDRLSDGLRQGKRRLALLTALADLAGVWSLEEVTGHLARFADLAVDVAVKSEIARLIKRGKLPGQGSDDVDQAGGLVVLAMGKMGAGELNYSSDIDLICLFDETRFDPDAYLEARQAFVRATRAMSTLLSEKTAEGYVFRTDLRLRPDPSVTPVCIAMEAAERYYESFGRTWERAAYIKARPSAGDLQAGGRFLDTLRPFVWRRHLDFAAIQDAHDIRLRIRESKRTGGPLTIPGHDMKLGRGGIREIEFFTQTRQLIAGGRDPGLRQRETCAGLQALAGKGWVDPEVATLLVDHYRVYREVEHRIQMVNDAQTHKIPASEDGLMRVACLMDRDPADLSTELTRRLTRVDELTQDFFAPDAPRSAAPVAQAHEFDGQVLGRWPTYPALRSPRAREIFERLRPELLRRLAHTARPDEALLALDGFLAGLPAGVQLFSLFEANPSLIDLLVDIAGTSPHLAQYLSRNAGVFDAVIAGSFFSDWPGEAALRAELTALLGAEPDYEAQLDAARRWQKDWHFRIGVHQLRGLIDAGRAGVQYAELASATLAGLAPVVTEDFARKHGHPPGQGAAIVGMGSLGAGRINARSDLDVIVIFDNDGVEQSDGRRPLAVRPYYARWTQALITAMTAPTAAGRLYEVDMRLRPSGKQGPVATSLASFCDYQANHAWLWEHLALIRARVIWGGDVVTAEIDAVRHDIITQPRDRATVLAAVADMRARLAAAKLPSGPLDAKTGPGRMLDIELVAESGALLSGAADRDVAAGLAAGVACGWLDAADAQVLDDAYALYWSVQTSMRLLSDSAPAPQDLGQGAGAFLGRATGIDGVDALVARLEDAYATCAAIIDRAVGEPTGETE